VSESVCTVLLSVFGVLIGGLITYLVSKYYYVKAAKESETKYEKAANDLKEYADIFGNFLQGIRKGKDVNLEFTGQGGLTGLGVIVHHNALHVKLKPSSQTKLVPPEK